MPEKIVSVAEGMRQLNIETDDDLEWLIAHGGIPKPLNIEAWSESTFREIEKAFKRRYRRRYDG